MIVYGTTGNDNKLGTSANDFIYGYAGNDLLQGLGGNDFINGGTGNDTLNGGTGNDSLYGGEGSDTYYVDSASDLVVEYASSSTYQGGYDTVKATVNYTLTANVEALELLGTAVYGTGNSLNNSIKGNSVNNVLSGLGGGDNLYGQGGNDTLYGGQGIDVLDGGTGSDYLSGGTENDYYYVDNVGDKVVEYATTTSYYGGYDSVYSTISYTLTNNVEGLSLLGTAFSGTGNSLNNSIWGNDSANILNGKLGNDYIGGGNGNDYLYGEDGDDQLQGNAGNDKLYGGIGNDRLVGASLAFAGETGIGNTDTLTGGEGKDTFILGGVQGSGEFIETTRFYNDGNVFTSGTSDYALITDFKVGEDLIQLAGKATDYAIKVSPIASDLVTSAIYLKGVTVKGIQLSDELIAVVQNVAVADLNLNSSQFSYIPLGQSQQHRLEHNRLIIYHLGGHYSIRSFYFAIDNTGAKLVSQYWLEFLAITVPYYHWLELGQELNYELAMPCAVVIEQHIR